VHTHWLFKEVGKITKKQGIKKVKTCKNKINVKWGDLYGRSYIYNVTVIKVMM